MSVSDSRLSGFIARARVFLQRDVWDVEMSALNSARRIVVRTVRVLQLVLRGFRRDECVLHASSLTFMTLLSFIPVLAIALSMARAFGDPNMLRDHLKDLLHEWIMGEEVVEEVEEPLEPAAAPKPSPSATSLIADEERQGMMGRPDETLSENVLTEGRLDEMIDTAFERIGKLNFGALGGIGVALLLWTVISMLSQVEAAFNRVWGVTEQRTFYRKFTDYLSVVVVVPLLVTAASTIPASNLLARLASATGAEGHAMTFWMRFLRGCGMMALLTLSLAFVLRFVPNTKVRLWPGMGGGFLVAIAMTLWLRICLTFQIGLAKYSTFFGSFAVVPLLLFWVYVSWIILLVGAELSFGLQNADTYRMEGDSRNASLRTRMLLAVDIAASAAQSVRAGSGLLKVRDWAFSHRVPVRLVNDILAILVRRGLLVETAADQGEFAVLFDVETASVADVLLALLDDGDAPSAVGIRAGAHSPLGEAFGGRFKTLLPMRLVDLSPEELIAASK